MLAIPLALARRLYNRLMRSRFRRLASQTDPSGGAVSAAARWTPPSRGLAQKLAEQLGQPVVVDNRPGAGGNIGMDAVAKAAPEFYTIGMGALSTRGQSGAVPEDAL